MPATNSTTNYELPIFIGTDKPSWMGDWNGAMNKIDAALAEISANTTTAVTTANAASTTAQAAQTAVTALSGRVTDVETAQTGMRQDIQQNTQDIAALQNRPTPTFFESLPILFSGQTVATAQYYQKLIGVSLSLNLQNVYSRGMILGGGSDQDSCYQVGYLMGNPLDLPGNTLQTGQTVLCADILGAIVNNPPNHTISPTTLRFFYDSTNDKTVVVTRAANIASNSGIALLIFPVGSVNVTMQSKTTLNFLPIY